MNFQLKNRGVSCAPEFEDMVNAKVAKLERLVPPASYIEMELSMEQKGHYPGRHQAEIIVDLPGVKPVLRFQEHGVTLQEAADRVLDKVDEALKHHKDRRTDRRFHGVPPKEMLVEEVTPFVREDDIKY